MPKNKLTIPNILTIIFLFFFPLTGLKILHHNLTNLVIVIFVGLIFILTIYYYHNSRKYLKYLLLYYLLCLIYLLLSFWHSQSFNSYIPNEYSLFSEFLTILKLVMPITFLYSLYYQKLPKKYYLFIIRSWIIFISGLIIITNIFKVSLASYGDGLIKYNIFSWYKKPYYVDSASKGYFMYANQIAIIMLLLLIVISYYVINNKYSFIYVFLLGLAMLMLGTRVSSLGGFLTLLFITLFYLLICLLKKKPLQKRSFGLFIILFLWLLILPISPFYNRQLELNKPKINQVMGEVDSNQTIESKEEVSSKQEYVWGHYNPEYLPSYFFTDYYNIEYDEDFWYDFVQKYPAYQMNYRLIEKSIIKRMMQINNNKLDILLGISNVRIQNVVNLERDFVLQYYAFGIIGSLILLLIYVILTIYYLYLFFKNQTFDLFIISTCIVIFIFVSFLTGNILNSLFSNLSFVFIISGYRKEL